MKSGRAGIGGRGLGLRLMLFVSADLRFEARISVTGTCRGCQLKGGCLEIQGCNL